MAECTECESSETVLQDSHREYIDMVHFVIIKYYKCQECGNEFSLEYE